MLYIAWMVILGDHNIKKISFKNFDFELAGVKNCIKQVVYQSLESPPPPPPPPPPKRATPRHPLHLTPPCTHASPTTPVRAAKA